MKEILSVALQKDTAIDLDEKIRGYWLMRNFWNQDITQGQTQLAQVKRAITQTIVAKKCDEVTDDLREAGDRARNLPGGYAEAPNFHLHGNSDDDQADTIFRIKVKLFRAVVRAGWSRTRSSDQSERCTKETSTCDKIEKVLPKRWEAVQGGTGKSIDELKKVTSCNRCGAIGHWEEDCSQPARSRMKRKVVGSEEKNLMARDEEEVHRTTDCGGLQ